MLFFDLPPIAAKKANKKKQNAIEFQCCQFGGVLLPAV
jgi:hypothetical protein